MTESESGPKAQVRAWFRAMTACDYASLHDLMNEDVELWTAPSVREGAIAGREPALERLRAVLGGGAVFEAGSLVCEVDSIVGEGDETVSRVRMRGRFPNSKAYESTYLVWQRWRHGRLSYQFELFDAAHKNQQREARGANVAG